MKREGAGRWFVIVVSLLLALCAPLASLRFLGFFVCFLLLSALLYNRLTRRALSIERVDREVRGMRFQRIESRIRLSNRIALPVPGVIISEAAGSLHCDKSTHQVTLPSTGAVELSFALWGDRRGEYSYGPARMSGSDPFSFFRWQQEERTAGHAIVYPRVYPLELIDTFGLAGGTIPAANPAYEDITRFRSVREYVGGDELKRINWKVSAKTGRLYTTEYERTLSAPVRVVLDLASDDYPVRRRDQLLERAVEVAAALVFRYARRGQPIGFVAAAARGAEPSNEAHSSELFFAENAGWRHAELILECLARVRPSPGSASYLRLVSGPAREAASSLRILVVGPEANDAQVGELRAVRAARVHAEMYEVHASDAPLTRGALDSVLPVYRVTDFGEELLER